ncbi:MAG: uroporphyrinogen decarboxylase [Thiotrichales bacterium]|nr:MAG: uroporphyrinogen decarboxylase [Thiotrichales bacterium]
MLLNNNLIKALHQQPVNHIPIWMMRQAGRYLPEYRELRSRHKDFLTLCKTPELACEITLQPVKRFSMDAAIIFSDILVIPDAMQMGLSFTEGAGPQFANKISTKSQVEALPLFDVQEKLKYVMDAITLTKQELNNKVPLIGFAGSPWTLAVYMIQGGSSKTFPQIRKILYQAPDVLSLLLEKLTKITTQYLMAQINAGVDVIMLFDSWAGLLPSHLYEQFSLKYLRKIITNVNAMNPKQTPIILFARNMPNHLEAMANSGCNAVGIDWTMPIQEAKKRIGSKVALQGNLDPFVLYADKPTIKKHTLAILENFKNHPGYIFNLGHGIDKDTPIENVEYLIELVHEFT